jgi:hypothetical protein
MPDEYNCIVRGEPLPDYDITEIVITMPFKRYAKIGYTDKLEYYVYRFNIINKKRKV